MPELPEVETVMRGLAAVLVGAVIERAEVRRPDLRWPLPPGLAARLTGAQVLGFRRRAKYMLMRLSGGDSLLIHLGMSGRMVALARHSPLVIRLEPQGSASDARGHNAPPELHEHIVLETADWRPNRWRMVLTPPPFPPPWLASAPPSRRRCSTKNWWRAWAIFM
ncbi:MAG: hypothetical protein EBX37_15615 [Alphaproteobacteria bacterium]|nr:hypothetical protein [Alphaproteobacteria bacterium]